MSNYKTIEELKRNNGWASLTIDTLFDNDNDYRYYYNDKDKKELKCIEEYNNKLKEKNGHDKRILKLNVPPEPFWGNPLKAKIIILTKNPGYVEAINKYLPDVLSENSKKEIYAEKNRSMRLESNCLMQSKGVKFLSDLYWVKALKQLFEKYTGNDVTKEDEFYSHFALVQANAYTSEAYPETLKFEGKKNNLPSQQFTRELLFFVRDHNPNALFIEMRGDNEWKMLMGNDFFYSIKDRLIVNQHSINQSLTSNNLGEDSYNKILSKLNLI